jgi:general L-amino acid transport system permease protein
MVDTTTRSYEPGTHPSLPPPLTARGPILWMRKNLFGSPLNIFLTLVSIYFLYLIVPGALNWAVFDAVVNAESRAECREIAGGACWALIKVRFSQFLYGFYPEHLRWRIDLVLVLFFLALLPLLWDKAPYRRYWLIYSGLFPAILYFMLVGGMGLERVETTRIGGFTLNVVIGVTGIVASLPLGILLALGRRSHMPIVRTLCVMFIEFIRGVPLITLLFIATMLNYFLPPGTTFDLVLRVLIMVTLFSSAYMAEVVRGGLQAIPKGQFEAADAMGLGYWQSMRLIMLPQALKISIPGIVNTFVGLFKDTTLVVIIGLTDVLASSAAPRSPTRSGRPRVGGLRLRRDSLLPLLLQHVALFDLSGKAQAAHGPQALARARAEQGG